LKAAPVPWSTKLARPVPVIKGPTLRTLSDVRKFMQAMDEDDQLRQSWQHAAQLLLHAADTGDATDATKQVERALFLQAKWLGGK
jgi:hypothetical protein